MAQKTHTKKVFRDVKIEPKIPETLFRFYSCSSISQWKNSEKRNKFIQVERDFSKLNIPDFGSKF